MGEIRLPGLSTGIDTSALIEQLMVVNGRRLATYKVRKTELEEKASAVDEIRTLVNSYKSAVGDIADSTKLNICTATSSDTDFLEVSASSNAVTGSHSLEIKQLASSETMVQDTTAFSYKTDYVGGGSFIYAYNNKERVITAIENETTLEDLVNLINNDSDNPGVTAGLLYQGGQYHLMINGNQTGEDYSISVNSSNTELLQSQTTLTDEGENAKLSGKIIELDQFSGTVGTTSRIMINGTDKLGTAIAQVDLVITENTTIQHLLDSVNQAYDGVATAWYEKGKIYLADNSEGSSSISISLSFDPGDSGTASMTLPTFEIATEGGTVTADIASLSSATFVKTQTAQDSMIKIDGYPLDVDEWISRNSNTISDVISGVTFNIIGLPDDGETIDITINRDTEAIKGKVEEMVTAYNALMDMIEEKTGFDEEAKKMGILSSDQAVSFIKTRLRDPMTGILNGFDAENDSFSSAAEIGIKFDGSGRIVLDSSKLDDAINDDFAGLVKFLGAIGSGTSDSESVDFYNATKYTQAGQYNVRVACDASGNATGAWIKLASEDWSQARAATIDGDMIKATLDYSSSDPEKGMSLVFDWQNDGAHAYDPGQPTQGNPIEATINVRHGMGNSVMEILNEILDVGTGRLDMDDEYLDKKVRTTDRLIESEKRRLSTIEERLIAKYARLERTLSLLQQQFGAILGM